MFNGRWEDLMGSGNSDVRVMNVVLGPGSKAHRAAPRGAVGATGGAGGAGAAGGSGDLAAGFQPQPTWNLQNFGGPTIPDLTFVNRYVGGSTRWSNSDISNIDQALSKAMSDPDLQSVIEQYFSGSITTTMLPSAVHGAPVPATVYKDVAETLATQLHGEGVLGSSDPAKSIINMMLPRGVVLSDDFSPGFQPPAGQEQAHARRKSRVLRLDPDDAADSKNGLGGYHGSVHLADGTEIYYAVGVYSEGDNGIVAFPDASWKNVVATFYHELNEARTDAAVEDVNSTNNEHLLGWYSQTGQGEIGDLPINEASDISLVFQEVPLADGSGTVPIQLMWSNAAGGPARIRSSVASAV
jgi:hypothetical protein